MTISRVPSATDMRPASSSLSARRLRRPVRASVRASSRWAAARRAFSAARRSAIERARCERREDERERQEQEQDRQRGSDGRLGPLPCGPRSILIAGPLDQALSRGARRSGALEQREELLVDPVRKRGPRGDRQEPIDRRHVRAHGRAELAQVGRRLFARELVELRDDPALVGPDQSPRECRSSSIDGHRAEGIRLQPVERVADPGEAHLGVAARRGPVLQDGDRRDRDQRQQQHQCGHRSCVRCGDSRSSEHYSDHRRLPAQPQRDDC